MMHGDQSQWESFPEQPAGAGYAVLSIDLRGHGASGGEVDWDMAITDMQQVWDYFTARANIDQDRTAFVGASIGANLALVASSNEVFCENSSPAFTGIELRRCKDRESD